MRTSTLIKHNLTYYWRTNLAVVFGVATAVAVLAGALLVGDSVRESLRELFLSRLGKSDEIVSSAGFFREQLADDLAAHPRFAEHFSGACPLIIFEGLITHDKSGRRATGVQVYGVDDRFWKFHGRDVIAPDNNQILVSAGLAEELGSLAGDTLLLTIEKPQAIPAESLHGRKDDLGRTIRLTIRETLSSSALGEFSIRPQQGAVRAVFVPLRRLQKGLEQQGKVNTILLSDSRSSRGPQPVGQQVEDILRDTFALEDVAVNIRVLDKQHCLSLESDSRLINDSLLEAAQTTAAGLKMHMSSILTYLANTIRANGREIPYSVVTALDRSSFQSLGRISNSRSDPRPILLNDWAARDLGVQSGSFVELEYYVWQQEGRLITEKAKFQVAGILPIEGAAADRDLVPEYPGITETESLSDWDPPFPIDLSRVRPRDEQYWDQYRTTPKAFILLEDGQALWQSRFGKLTSIRIFPSGESDLQSALASYKQSLKSQVDPIQMGLSIYSARAQGLEASRGATDFGEYFVYFSFFLVVSALMLVALFFKLGIEQRLREIGILQAVGFHTAKIRNLFLSEAIILATAGSAVGLIGALVYGRLMMLGLSTWWVDAVGTRLLTLHVSAPSLTFGGAGAVIAALACIFWTLRRLTPASPRSLLAGGGIAKTKNKSPRPTSSRVSASPRLFSALHAAIAFGLLGFLLLLGAWLGWIGQVAGFFGAGTFLLVALLGYQSAWIGRDKYKLISGSGWWSLSRLGFRNITYRPGRSILCIALIASATFIIVAVDAFRRDDSESPSDKKSGTGGFPLIAESLVPLVPDPNTPEGRETLNLFADENSDLDGITFARFRLRPGDDASCLNLYQPRNPRVIAPTADFIQSNRFSFQSSLAESREEKENPWLLLDKEFEDGAIPIIADANSMTYVLHLKLGDEFILIQSGASPIRTRLVGALADSLFQGELLMSEKNFIRLFPDQEGYRLFLLDGAPERSAILEERLFDYGFDVVATAERLRGFHRVENTYLSTFQTLGGLGLILGTLGLATVLLRNILERRRELALLQSVGYNSRHFTMMIVAENGLLLFCGLITGTTSALLAIAPALFARGGRLPTLSLGLLLLLVLAVGLAASLLATAAALRSPLLPALRAE